MTLELNGVFVPPGLRFRVERHLRTAWARTNLSPSTFRVKWSESDPGNLVIGIEMGSARLLSRGSAPASSDREILARALMGELGEMLSTYLKAHHS